VLHDLSRVATVRQQVEQVVLGNEVETWEHGTFLLHEVLQSFLTNLKVCLHFCERLADVWLVTERASDLDFVSVSQNFSHRFVDEDELSTLLWQLTLDFIGVHEQNLKE